MNIFLILILNTIFYILITVRYFDFFKKTHLAVFSLLLFLILNIIIQIYFNDEVNLLIVLLQLGIIVAFRIHSNLFFLESPTLFLSKIILSKNGITVKQIKKIFLKKSFIDNYLSILKKEKFIFEKKNFFMIKKKGIIFFKGYKFLFKLLIR